MSYTKAHYEDGDEKAPGMYFLRDELDCENLGLTVVDVDADWSGREHDHAESGKEEVYYLVDGTGSVTVDGDDVTLEPGDAVRVAAASRRQLHAAESATFLITGAP
ncbi:cupin domain-containing protein [Halobellus sp. Atlit-31R]|nr:cupin domain-containing protein [Halobellus sp. Atlit-31R]